MAGLISSVGTVLPSLELASLLVALLLVYTATVYVYRIYFSPLSHIPGPKLAAATRWYEFYFDCIKLGSYYLEIERMHEQYGPIVRITPYEVHIDDPTFFHELYSVNRKLDKDPWYYRWPERIGSSFATASEDQHKLRAAPIKKAFSTTSISRIEPVLKDHFAILSRRLEEARRERKPVILGNVWRAVAVDIVTDLSLPESQGVLETPDIGAAHSDFIRGLTEMSVWNRHFPGFQTLVETFLPRWVLALKGQTALNVIDAVEGIRKQAQRVVENRGKPISSKNFPVIMNEVYQSDLPPEEKNQKRLFDEISVLIGAGSETIGHTLALISYHILANPPILKTLREEIRASFTAEELNDVLSYKKLETLPYLNACLNEGLRMATPVSGRLPRTNNINPTTYMPPPSSSNRSPKSYIIPPGYPVSMTVRDMHENPTCFPSPKSFNPARWLGDQKAVSEKWLAPFGQGSRSCVGRNLAMAELQMAVGNLFGRYELEFVDGKGDREDVAMVHDCFSAFPKRNSKGVAVLVR